MDEQELPPTKARLLELIGIHRGALEAAIAGLTPEQFETAPEGVWSVKDNLAHLTAWQQSIVALLRGEPRHSRMGVSSELYLSHNVDAINDAIYLQHRDTPLDEVLTEFHRSHRETLALLEPLGDADLQQTYSYYLPDEPGEDSGAPVMVWLAGNTYQHDASHLEMILALPILDQAPSRSTSPGCPARDRACSTPV